MRPKKEPTMENTAEAKHSTVRQNLDDKDLRIIDYIIQHSDARAEDLARTLDYPLTTVHRRLLNLLRSEVLERGLTVRNWSAIGYPLRYDHPIASVLSTAACRCGWLSLSFAPADLADQEHPNVNKLAKADESGDKRHNPVRVPLHRARVSIQESSVDGSRRRKTGHLCHTDTSIDLDQHLGSSARRQRVGSNCRGYLSNPESWKQ